MSETSYKPRHRYCRYKFDFGGLILERYPCGFEPPSINVETLHGEFDEEIHPVSPVENRVACRELEDILHEVGKISDEEFAEIKRQHLPALYRPLTDNALRKVLATLDIGIVQLLIGHGTWATGDQEGNLCNAWYQTGLLRNPSPGDSSSA